MREKNMKSHFIEACIDWKRMELALFFLINNAIFYWLSLFCPWVSLICPWLFLVSSRISLLVLSDMSLVWDLFFIFILNAINSIYITNLFSVKFKQKLIDTHNRLTLFGTIIKLDGSGPVDNRPSTNQLLHFVQQEKNHFLQLNCCYS